MHTSVSHGVEGILEGEAYFLNEVSRHTTRQHGDQRSCVFRASRGFVRVGRPIHSSKSASLVNALPRGKMRRLGDVEMYEVR